MKATLLSGILAATIALAAPAHADVDTDFANELHTYGIYGQRDYNAWLAKITCERLYRGVDTNAEKSAEFSRTTCRAAPAPRRLGNSSPPQSTPTAPTSNRS